MVPNSLDSEVVGANRAALEVTWNAYDRLCTFGLKKDENGNDYYDYTNIQPELAEEWNVTDQSITFKLRKDATFHDGTPITAKDVKYSYDRAVGVGGYPKFILGAVSMTKPEQFVAVDDHTFRHRFHPPRSVHPALYGRARRLCSEFGVGEEARHGR